MEKYSKEFWIPKHGYSENEYEDAYSTAVDQARFAVADGAAEASFSGAWARQLVRAFTKKELSVPISLGELVPLQVRWQKNIAHRHPLPWYAEEKASNGAFAAFIGLELSEEQGESKGMKIWRATAVGDSCLVQVRGDEIIQSFPLSNSHEFSNRPNLLCSSQVLNLSSPELVTQSNGTWGCDDVFFLMTDALACWFFKERELGHKPWILLRNLDTQDSISFEGLISELRSDGRIKNDDVTLLRVDVL